MAEFLWTTRDCRGRTISLHESNWRKHFAKRPQIQGLELQSRATVEDPNVCVRESDGSVNYYKLGVVPSRPRAYLHVVARDDGERTTVRTVWIAFAVNPFEEFLCPPKMI